MHNRQCLICKKELKSIKQCSEHFKICRRSLKCQKCNQVFNKLTIYHAHVSICNGLHEYKCSGCGMCFSDKKKTYNHMYKCKKKFMCRRCSMPFQDWRKLLNHCEISHPKIECKICRSFYKSGIIR